jgi:uracil-DNA glycosylase family 4
MSERSELASIAASLRAYLEIQSESGATGIPKRTSPPQSKQAPAPASTTPSLPAAPPLSAPPISVAPLSAPPISLEPATVPVPVSESTPITVRALPLLEQIVASCTKCELSKTRNKTVFSRGNPHAALCFVGEAPGADEDEQGLPFVGKAGQLLDRMIAAMGLKADDVYVCNIIKCRPPGNRRPTAVETTSCIPYLNEQLANVSPKVIVAMGNTSAQTLLDTKLGITRLRGEWKLYRGKTLLMPTYHPSYLLRESPIQKLAKQEAWEDLQKVMKELGLPPPAKGTHPPGYRPPPEEAPTPSVAFPPSTKKSP